MRARTKLILLPLFLLLLLLILIHIPPVQEWISSMLLESIQHTTGTRISWSRFRFTLLPPRATVDGLSVTSLLTAKRIRYSPGLIITRSSLDVEGLRLNVTDAPSGKRKPLSLPSFLKIGRVRLRDSFVSFQGKKVPLNVNAYGVTLKNRHLAIHHLEWYVEEYDPVTVSLNGDITEQEGGFVVQGLSLTSDHSRIRGKILLTLHPLDFQVTFSGTGDAGHYADQFHLGLPISGEAAIRGKFSIKAHHLALDATWNVPDLIFNGHSLGKGTGSFNLISEKVNRHLTLLASTPESRLTFKMDFHHPFQSDLTIKAPAIAPQRIFEVLNLPSIRAPKRARATLTYHWMGKNSHRGSGKVRFGAEDDFLVMDGILEDLARLQALVTLRALGGSATFEGTIPFDKDTPVTLSGNAANLPVEVLFDIIRPHLPDPPPLTTGLSGGITVDGTWRDPRLSYRGKASKTAFPPFTLEEGTADISVTPEGLVIHSSAFHPGGGEVGLKGVVPFAGEGGRIEVTAESFEVPAPISVKVDGEGSLAQEMGEWIFRGKMTGVEVLGYKADNCLATATYIGERLDVEMGSVGVLGGEGKGMVSYDGTTLAVTLSEEKACIPGAPLTTSFSLSLMLKEDLLSIAGGGKIEGNIPHGCPATFRCAIERNQGNYSITLANGGGVAGSVDLSDLPLLKVDGKLSGLAPEILSTHLPFELSDNLEAAFSADLPLEDIVHLSGKMDVSPFHLSWRDQVFTLPEGLSLRANHGRITAGQVPLDHPYGILGVKGEGEIASDPSAQVTITGYFGDDLIKAILPKADFFGDGTVNLTLKWRTGTFSGSGDISLEGKSFNYPPLSIFSRDLNAEIVLEGRKISLKKTSARIGEGTLSLNGNIVLGPSLDFKSVNFTLTGERIPLPFIDGLDSLANLDVRLLTMGKGMLCSGDITLIKGLYTKELTILDEIKRSVLKRKVKRATRNLPAVSLALNVKMPGTLQIRNTTIQAKGGGKMVVGGTLASPTLLGRITVEGGGTFEFNGVKYDIVGAILDFNNPLAVDPLIHLNLTTDIRDYTVNVQMSGRLDYLHTQFSSQPYLPQEDILTLIFGSTQSGTPGGGFKGGLFTEQLSKQLTRQANLLFGLTRVRLEPIIGGESSTSTARVTLSKQINKNCLLNYVYTPSSREEDLVSVECSVGHGAYLNAYRETDGSYYMEIHKRVKF